MVVDLRAAVPEVPAHHPEFTGDHGAQLCHGHPGQARQYRPAGHRLDRRERRHGEHGAARRLGRGDTGLGVLDGHAGGRVDTQGTAGGEVRIRGWLGVLGVVGGDRDREAGGAECSQTVSATARGEAVTKAVGTPARASASSRSSAPGRGTMPVRTRAANSRCSSAASGPAAELLDIRRTSPLLRVRRVTTTREGRPVEWSDDRYRGDAVSFSVHNSIANNALARKTADKGNS